MTDEYQLIHREIRVEGVVLGVSEQYGALVVYTSRDWKGGNIEIWLNEDAHNQQHANVVERTVNGRSVFAAIFPRLKLMNYTVARFRSGKHNFADVTVYPGEVAEVDWTQKKEQR